MTIKIIKKDQESKNALESIFNSDNNPTFCAAYGGGNHCDNPQRTALKFELWGNRGEENNENTCNVARIIYLDNNDTPAALFNIGATGKTPTIIDKTNTEYGKVYEFSSVFITEEYLPHIIPIAINISDVLRSCEALEGYTKAFVAININSPYQKELFSAVGGILLDETNYIELLGSNSFHPERFKFNENGQFLECNKWNAENSPIIEHEGWHNSQECIGWTQKDAFVFDISGNHIETHSEL